MAEVTTLNVLNGYAKDLYTKLKDLVPEGLRLFKLPFDEENAQGGTYRQNVIVSEEAGFTHAASGDGAVTLNTAVSMETQDAQVTGYQVALVGTIDYESAERASNSKRAYADIVGKKQANMLRSAQKRVECELWWGQAGLGKINSYSNVDTTNTRLQITLGTHAPFIWAGKKNFQIIVYNGTTQVGSALFTITKVDVKYANRYIWVTGTSGDITALQNAVGSSPDVLDIFWASAAQGTTLAQKSMLGVMKAANTTSGNLWNIDVQAYDLWSPNQFNFNSTAANFDKLLNAVEDMIGRGLSESVIIDLHPRTWSNVMKDQAALRRFGGKERDLGNGAATVEFVMQNDVITSIESTPWMKDGNGLIRPKDGLKRIGARDVSFRRPGKSGGPGDIIFYDDPSRMGYSYRVYTHQSFFCEEPWKLNYLYGISNA